MMLSFVWATHESPLRQGPYAGASAKEWPHNLQLSAGLAFLCARCRSISATLE
jgi:hypothetical protein